MKREKIKTLKSGIIIKDFSSYEKETLNECLRYAGAGFFERDFSDGSENFILYSELINYKGNDLYIFTRSGLNWSLWFKHNFQRCFTFKVKVFGFKIDKSGNIKEFIPNPEWLKR